MPFGYRNDSRLRLEDKKGTKKERKKGTKKGDGGIIF
jgi:hypothetical protein